MQGMNPIVPPHGERTMTDSEAYAQLKSAQTLITVAFVCAPVSLIFGGVVLSIAALVCSGIAMGKISKVASGDTEAQGAAIGLRTQVRLALALSIVALALNLVSAIYMTIMILQAMSSGDFSALDSFMNGGFFGGSAESPEGSSVWNR